MFVVTFNLKKKVRLIAALLALVAVILSLGFSVDAIASSREGAAEEASSDAVKRRVIIDAGHGGEDGGAVGVDGTLEKDVCLAIALMIGEELSEKGIEVVYTRTDDKMLYLPEENIKGIRKLSDLKGRVRLAENDPDAIFVSIHLNSYAGEKYHGLEVYYSEENKDSLILAEKIRSSVVREAQPDNKRALKSGEDLYLLKHISNPAVLIECGFLSNEEECKKLSQKEYQKLLSFSIVCGIIDYMKEGLSP